MDAHITGLPENETGFYGFHIHEKGDCTGDFEGAGGHYNPEGLRHPLHAGDFPMLLGTRSGQAWLSFITGRFTVREVLGRAVIVHDMRDDYTSQPSGDAGDRIGCGVIRAV